MLSLVRARAVLPCLGAIIVFLHGAKQKKAVAENRFRRCFKIVLTALSGRMRMIAKL